MCGICGVRRFGQEPISRDAIDLLILNNQNRGLEAAGIALQQANGEVVIHKDNVTPLEFVASEDYDNFMKENLREDTLTAIGHTRKATVGNPKIIANNHPMFAGVTALVHNGHINDHERWFKDWKLERKAETDSDILRAVLDKEGFTHKAIDILSRLSGNAAFAAISPKFPGKLLLARSGNPIEMAATKDFLYWSSEKGPLHQALRPYKTVFGITMREMTPISYYMIGMNDHSAWLISDKPKEGSADIFGNYLDWHMEMKIASNFTPVLYTCHAQYHGNRVKFYDERPVDVAECPGCGRYISVSQAGLKELKRFTCKKCGSKLA